MRVVHPYLLCLLVCASLPALAQPRIPPPTLKGVVGGDIVARGRVRWSKVVDGERVDVLVAVGVAERTNPHWSKSSARLKYDLPRNRALERALKQAHLGPANSVTAGAEDRTLEVLGRGPDGWVVVGSWTYPRKRWQKQYRALYQQLEPLFDEQAETFAVPPQGSGR